MKNDLNNNKLIYDESRKKEMQDFLNYIYDLIIQNQNNKLDDRFVYSQLCFFGLPSYDKNDKNQGNFVRRFFDRWEEKLKTKKTDVFCLPTRRYWLNFQNGIYDTSGFIKLYVPINTTHLFESINQIIKYLEDNDIHHESKVGEEVRCDNFIIRLGKDDYKSAKKIIDFLNSNKYIKSGLNKPNPFIPTVDGIGVINEFGGSYNGAISKLVYAYIEECILNNKLPNIDEFKKFMTIKNNDADRFKKYEMDDSVIPTFDSAYSGKKIAENSKIKQVKFKTKQIEKKEEKTTQLSPNQKLGLLMECINKTYKKYGYEQAEYALISAASGDYSYFSGENLRKQMQENFTGEEISFFIKFALGNMVPARMINSDIISNIKLYARTLLANNSVLALDEACGVTLDKYGKSQLDVALRTFIQSGDARCFARSSGLNNTDYRDVIERIGKDNIIYNIIQSLKSKGCDIFGLNEEKIIDVYTNVLEELRFKNAKEGQMKR